MGKGNKFHFLVGIAAKSFHMDAEGGRIVPLLEPTTPLQPGAFVCTGQLLPAELRLQ